MLPELEDVLIDGRHYLTTTATCCRTCVVVVGVKMGRCGHCGQVPSVERAGDAA